jgi:hypothetical protein
LTAIRSHAREHELEGRRRIWLDVVPAEPKRSVSGPFAPETDVNASVYPPAAQARVLRAVVGERALTKAYAPTSRPRRSSSRSLEIAISRVASADRGRERPVPDAVRLDADPTRLQRGELVPVDGAFSIPSSRSGSSCGRATVVEERDRTKTTAG